MRLVVVTQRVDPEHPVLAATVPKLHALARRFEEVAVLAASAVPGALPGNCRVVAYGADSRLARGRLYAAALNRELARRPAAVLVHMVPLLAVLAAPLARPRRVPILLWFTHWRRSRTLVLAERVASRVLTVDRRSFPLESGKVAAIGHGIDLERFACGRREPAARLRVVALGRTSPAKGYETIVRAAALADVDLELRGPSLTAEERAERARLEALGARVEEPVPYAGVPALLLRKDVLVNNMREGALDKVVYEAAATCMPVLASNSGFEDVLPPELRFGREDPDDLAAKLRRLREADRNAIGIGLRAAVAERHSVEHWADGVVAAVTG
ncbi:MAG TPA: glycosyltransferase family 4 protein [Gaiellaceae bacterium]|nr:glycosyltransferase family 4 protein [Gaiellaceae bacterium]